MAIKHYQWESRATLDDHSRCKLKILRDYFFKYILVRCQHPHQRKFRLAVVDGFSGGGRYDCGTAGSPLIFIEELQKAITDINLHRTQQNIKEIEIECLLIFNDSNINAIEIAKNNCNHLIAETNSFYPKLCIKTLYLNDAFERIYPEIKHRIDAEKHHNVLFNLDQYGHSSINQKTIIDIMNSMKSVEIFLTFSIKSLLAFLPKEDTDKLYG